MSMSAGPLHFDDLLVDDGGPASGSGPTVVLLHPSGFGPDIMRPFAAVLAEDHRVVLPHRRGYGGSAALTPATSLDDHHADLVALIDALGLVRPVLVGVSAGSTLTLGFTVEHPELVGGAVFHEPLLGPLGGQLHDVVTERIGELLATADEPHHAGLFMSSLVGLSEWNGLREDWRVSVDANAATVCNEARLFASFAVTDRHLRALPTNVVATVGERSSPLRTDLAAVLSAHGVTTRVLPDARHLPMIENPAALAATVADVVAACGPTPGRTEGAFA
jgi:pimeloyl-ACP methyl ester carboxylesterase